MRLNRDTDSVVQAAHEAIERARQQGHTAVEPDDLLLGLLDSLSRFGVVQIGDWTIDLEALDGGSPAEPSGQSRPTDLAYSEATAKIFDRAAEISREDGAPRVSSLHLLVAFGDETGGLMARLRDEFGFDSLAWRAALAGTAADSAPSPAATLGGGVTPAEKELLSPDEAAELLGVHTQTVRAYIRGGKLPAFRLAGERAIRIKRSDLFALLEPVQPEDAVLPPTTGGSIGSDRRR